MDSSKKLLIGLFLGKLKTAIDNYNINFIPRQENRKTLAQLQLNKLQAREIIYNLTIENFLSGPLDDKDQQYGGTMWEFGITIKNREVYIKVKLDCINNTELAKCISFHFANKQLRFPYKTNT